MTKRILKGIIVSSLAVLIVMGLIVIELIAASLNTGVYQQGAGEYTIVLMASAATYIVSVSYYRYINKMEALIKRIREDKRVAMTQQTIRLAK